MIDVQYVSDSTGKRLFVQLPIEVFDESVKDSKELKTIHLNTSPVTDKPKAYSVKEIRKEHASDYSLWTDEEERQLKIMFFQDFPINEIALKLGRNKGAITSRLRKLGIPYTE
ncbi:hypothetical protein J2I47_05685 [Fibrella sp. HMF5335]|uniref:Sigma-70, region 4 n=1 Tax=Fibrella rubiginis TaxID=2817060 RepID=A0A939GGF6_9BACT|nr:hypothetical protein [Fibrella rubiginis]MBO0936032.1 hypothetical protein [Fibrella rubiginis]